MTSVVDGKLRCSEVLVPVGLLEIDAGAQNFFEGAVGSFGLSVGLRMMRRAHRERRAKLGPERAPEVRGETRIAITENRLRQSADGGFDDGY